MLSNERLDIHHNIKRQLQNYYTKKNIPHILFYGENGCGKKTLVMDFINLIYDGDKRKIRQNTLFSNCSYSKGIRHIRENLKEYSRSNVSKDENVYFKSIILYNFENLSIDGQSALRRVIESYSHTTRFFLILQSKEKLLQPILSRFAPIFVPLPIINGSPVNLYQYHLNKMFHGADYNLPHVDDGAGDGGGGGDDDGSNLTTAPISPIKLFLEDINKSRNTSSIDLVILSKEMVERSESAIDLMRAIDKAKNISEYEKSRIHMCFYKIKSEFRCESMLILYLLTFLLLRSEMDLKNVCFM